MRKAIAGLVSGVLICSFTVLAYGQGKGKGKPFEGNGPPPWANEGNGPPAGVPGASNPPIKNFNRVGTFANYLNQSSDSITTVSEIVAVTADGNTLVYTDAESGTIGFVDITDPENPIADGLFDLSANTLSVGPDPEPTSVGVTDGGLALVGVNTSTSFVTPSGELQVVDVASRAWITTVSLGGQPDSVSISPDGQFAAIAIENERDEDIEVGGVEGGLPQLPAGFLAVVDIGTWAVSPVAMPFGAMSAAGCYGPSDAEPEFVDINEHNQAVVTMQENNCIAVVDLESLDVETVFNAGTVDLDEIDATEGPDVISLSESLEDVPREPDGVTWVRANNGNYYIATANEGDLFGGSRGFSIFDQDGKVLYDSGNLLEHIAVRLGHYPEARSANKGTEMESIEFATFNPDLIFVGSERGSFVSVFELRGNANPVYRQTLPAPLGPEGLLAIPERNLLIASGEEDDPPRGVRSTIMIYRLESGEPNYPELLSDDDENGTPTPWSAMSGMTAAPGGNGDLLAVWDSFYDDSRIFTIDTSTTPARVTDSMLITDPFDAGDGNLDPEGIAVAPDLTYWIASEGNASGSRQNRLLHVDPWGVLLEEILLPEEIQECRADTNAVIEEILTRIEELQELADEGTASPGELLELATLLGLNLQNTLGSGFEGVEVIPMNGSYRLYLAQQRGWNYRPDLNGTLAGQVNSVSMDCEDLDDDQLGLNAKLEPNATRIWVYNPDSGEFEDSISWELAPLTMYASWIGLSEITRYGDSLILIERDNRTGDWAGLKSLARVSIGDLEGGVAQGEKTVYDLLPDMLASKGWISDKPEGFAVNAFGDAYVITDNDGVDDWSGETLFLDLGQASDLVFD